MANLITVGRLILLFVVIWMIYVGNVQVIEACMVLVIVVFASDGLDGWVARKRKSTSPFGAVFDIAGDRIVENTLWVIFADLDLIPVWIPLMVVTRGFLVDGLRSLSYAEGMTAFGDQNMMRSAVTQWLTAGRFMRGLFGWAKSAGFVFLTGLVAWSTLDTDGTALGSIYSVGPLRWFGWALVWIAVTLTVIRALPVFVDSIALIRGVDRKQVA
ncbi:MAG: CDP-alcohol phosphatidyltransferase family protein [Chloroflexia bacterium]|jgi:CDP-diacylglycerol--glycerol-3-phosphate 3-phosphatidyltransferase|nr:CDP-alcohol phosphatidyltransferase family protein [Chloroflexia bacterium]